MDNLKNIKILYVEDDELIRENTAEILKRKCDNVITAEDGLEGLELYEKFSPDLIITDIQMPRLDGLSMIKKIRENDLTTKIVITTAYTDQKYLLEAVEMQLIKYVSKPLTWDKISTILKTSAKHLDDNTSTIKYIGNDFTYNTFSKTLYNIDKPVVMSKHETLLLELLVKQRNHVVEYEAIENFVWPEIGMSKDAIKSLTKGLRKKLPQDSLENIYSMGYKLNVRDTEDE